MDVNGEVQTIAALPQRASSSLQIGGRVHLGASRGVLEMGKSLAPAGAGIK
jgi:hypothetical protein